MKAIHTPTLGWRVADPGILIRSGSGFWKKLRSRLDLHDRIRITNPYLDPKSLYNLWLSNFFQNKIKIGNFFSSDQNPFCFPLRGRSGLNHDTVFLKSRTRFFHGGQICIRSTRDRNSVEMDCSRSLPRVKNVCQSRIMV